jgi:ATP-dependent RNA helicase DeaD
VCEKQLLHLVNKLHTAAVNEKEIEEFLPKAMAELADLSKEELIKRIVAEEFNRFLNYYQNTPDLNDGKEGNNNRTTRFFINLGEMDGLNRNSLKDLLMEVAGVEARMIFNIEVKNSFAFFETETVLNDKFLSQNNEEVYFNDRKLSFEVSQKKQGGGSFGGGNRSERFGGGKSGGYSGGGYKGGSGDRGYKGGYKGDRGGKSEGGYAGKKKYSDNGNSFGGKKSYDKSSKFSESPKFSY